MDGITGVKYAIGATNFTGKGVKIGIIDSGIDYTHPSIGGKMGLGQRVTHGYNFIDNNEDPMDDCNGHGTHVAGIISSNDANITSIAPGATLGVYRVIGCGSQGTVTAGNLIAAMEKAADDGMDIINLSVGGPTGWSEHPLARKASWLVNVRNITVIASSGNDGIEGLWHTSVLSLGKGVVSACSFDAGKYLANYFLTPDASYDFNFMIWGSDYDLSQLPDRMNGKEVYALYKNPDLDYHYGCKCPPEAKGKWVLAMLTRCSVQDKAEAAHAAGALGVLLVNTFPGMPTMATADLMTKDVLPVPVLGISIRSGDEMIKRIKNGELTQMTFQATPKLYGYQGGSVPSYFSSWGLDPELHVKPSVCGPGRYVYSTYPQRLGGHATASGTSQAAPFITGAAALLLERARSLKKPMPLEHQRALLQNSGIPANASSHRLNGVYFPLASVAKQGSGLIRINGISTCQAVVTPPSFSFNDTVHASVKEGWEFGEDLEIFSYSDLPVTYEVEHIPSQSLSISQHGLTSSPVSENVFATIQLNVTRFTLPPWGSVKVQVLGKRPSPDSLVGPWIYSGYIRFLPITEDNSVRSASTLHVPYSGYLGDLSKAEVLDNSISTLPSIFQYQEGLPILYNETTLPNMSFSFSPTEDPLGIGFRLIFPAKLAMVEIVGEDRKQNYGWIPRGYQRWLPRNGNTTGSPMHFLQWTGTKMSDIEVNSIFSERELSADNINTGLNTYPGNGANANLTEGADGVLRNSRGEELVADGIYRLKLSVLRPFRNMETLSPEDYHIWYSPPIHVDRRVELASARMAVKEGLKNLTLSAQGNVQKDQENTSPLSVNGTQTAQETTSIPMATTPPVNGELQGNSSNENVKDGSGPVEKGSILILDDSPTTAKATSESSHAQPTASGSVLMLDALETNGIGP